MKPLLRAVILCCVWFSAAPVAAAPSLSPGDRQLYHDAFAAAKAGDWPGAWRHALQANDPILMKALRWLDLSREGTTARFVEIAEFVKDNPDWPGLLALRQRAEETMAGVPDAVLDEWFSAYKPVTPAGRLRQADIWLAQGKREAAVTQIREVWVNADFGVFEEKSVLQRYHELLRPADHVHRLDRLLWDGQAEAVRRMLPRVEPDYRFLADARMKLAQSVPGVEKAVAHVPGYLQGDPGLLYERLRWRRRKEMYDEALEILQHAPADLVRPTAWWTERQILARRALTNAEPALAYSLTARHGMTSGAAFAEAEFLAGWIALRFLKQPSTAYDHFVRLYDEVKLPMSVARGAYWAGRAADGMQFHELAGAWYATAAEQVTTYYGQLALAKLEGASPPRPLAEPRPNPQDLARFDKNELVRVARALGDADAGDYVKPFINRLTDTAQSPIEYAMIAKLADGLERPDLAVSAAKRASYAGVTLLAEGYPVEDMPPGGNAEQPLILAVMRQESAFEREAVSRSGARGLMQLMPATASQIAKTLQVPYSLDRLSNDAHYNVSLGRAYLEGLLDSFSGSYVLAIAGYNAGPARARQWIRDYGDPRTPGVDVIDWIESIPYSETRNYVQRVLENLQVYRLRLGDQALAFSLPSDLRR